MLLFVLLLCTLPPFPNAKSAITPPLDDVPGMVLVDCRSVCPFVNGCKTLEALFDLEMNLFEK